MKNNIFLILIVAALCGLLLASCGRDSQRLDGHWKLVLEKSASIDPWADLVLDIQSDGTRITIVKRYSAGLRDRRADSMTVNTQGNEEIVHIPPGRWLGEVSMGIYYGPEAQRHVVARMSDSNKGLELKMRETLETAQGEIEVAVTETYELSPSGSTIRVTENRSTRKSGPPLTYTFAPATQ